MPFIQPEPFTFFNIKFTDHGRRLASTGQINFNSVIISDREIDYSIDRDGKYDILNNKILDITDYYQDSELENYDATDSFTNFVSQENGGPDFLPVNNTSNFNVTTERLEITGSTSSTTISNFVKGTKTLAYSSNSSNWGTNKITFAGGGYSPVVNDVVAIPWVSPDYSGSYNPTTMPQNDPCVLTFYKITSAVTAGSVYLVDRPIPDFDTGPSLTCQFFRDDMIESYYGSGTTTDPGVWNMNIVRTNNVIGTQISTIDQISGFTTYGSIQYNGTKHFFGFKNELPAFGVIHYTNKFTGNTYAEMFVEGTFEMNLPGIMWHHCYTAYYNNDLTIPFDALNASGTTWGLFLSDAIGVTMYDPISKSTYRDLYDGRNPEAFSVGRVYHKLQIIIITDQELLTALSYKSNRNYTLPDYELYLSNMPQLGLYPAYAYSASTVSGYTATGLIDDGYDYFITYIAENEPYSSGLSIGNAPALPCGYIKKIKGSRDNNGNEQYLKLRFTVPNSFPYMRDDNELSNVNLGTGWNANTVQLLVNKQLTSDNFDIANVPSNQWVRVSDKTLGGNGVYRALDYGDDTIDAKKLNVYEFVISKEDYLSGSTYLINTGMTINQDYLNFGDEYFVYGTIKTGIAASVYKTKFQVYVDDSNLNRSNNSTFDPEIDNNTYITEIAVLDDKQNVVAVGKPTYPIRKNNIRWLTLQLDIDF
jgi:hypothetical protein